MYISGESMAKKKEIGNKELEEAVNTLCQTTEHSLTEIALVMEQMARAIKHISMRLEMLEDHFYNGEPPELEDDKIIN